MNLPGSFVKVLEEQTMMPDFWNDSNTSSTVLKKINAFSVVGTSIVGGVAHNLGQILVAIFLFDTVQIGYYMAVLAITGTIAGVFIGLTGTFLLKRLEKYRI